MQILVLEDEEKTAGAICEGFRAEHYEVTAAKTGEDGFLLASSWIGHRAVGSGS